MTIKKYGHACILVEKDGVKILLDPGSFNPLPDATGVAAILITHEHGDHYDPEQVKALVANNPGVRVITHVAVAEKMKEAGIECEVIEPGLPFDVDGLLIESIGTEHAAIYKTSPCRNTGFFIAEELFVPGDAIHDIPSKPVRLLALPTGGPWMKIAEAIDYAKAVKPKVVFPIHDAMYIETVQRSFAPNMIGRELVADGIAFVDLAAGETKDF